MTRWNPRLEVLGLSVRATNCLARLHVQSVEQLVALVASGLPPLAGMGKRTVREIEEFVANLDRANATGLGAISGSPSSAQPDPAAAQSLRETVMHMSDPTAWVSLLGLSGRAYSTVARLGIRTPPQLIQHVRRGLPLIPGVGYRTANELEAAVRFLEGSADTPVPNSLAISWEASAPAVVVPPPPSLSWSTLAPKLRAQLLRAPGEILSSERACNALTRAGIRLIGDLVLLDSWALLRMPSMGKLSVHHIEARLATIRLQLGMQIQGWPPEHLEEWRHRLRATLALVRDESLALAIGVGADGSRTLEDELEYFAGLAGDERGKRIVLTYLGYYGGRGHTLASVGAQFRLTRERVRQLLHKAQTRFRRMSARPERATAALRAIADIAPASETVIQDRLLAVGLLRTRLSISCVLRAGGAMLRRRGSLAVRSTPEGKMVGAYYVSRSSAWIRAAARRAVSRRGVGYVPRLPEEVRARSGYCPDANQIVNVLAHDPSIAWLDEARHWFWIAPPRRNRLLTIVRKIMAVSERVPLLELREGIQRHYHMGGFAPPTPVLRALLVATGEWTIDRDDVCVGSRSPIVADVLSKTERALYQALRSAGPVMNGYDLVAHAVQLGAGEMAVNVALSYSPILRRPAMGVYSLRGAVLDPGTISAVRESSTGSGPVVVDYGWSASREIWLALRASRGFVRTGIFALPSGLTRQLQGTYDVFVDERPTGHKMTIREGSAWGLKPILVHARAKVGDTLLLRCRKEPSQVHVIMGTHASSWGSGADSPSGDDFASDMS